MAEWAGEEMPYVNEADMKQQRRRVEAEECAGMLYVWGGNMCNQLAVESPVDQPWVCFAINSKPWQAYPTYTQRFTLLLLNFASHGYLCYKQQALASIPRSTSHAYACTAHT